METNPIIKVTFTLADGTIQYITGDELARWQDFNERVASCAHLHHMNPEWNTVKWKTVSPTKTEY